MNDKLLEHALLCLQRHRHQEWGDRHPAQAPMDVFNRLLAKNIRPAGHTNNTHLDIQPSQLCSRLEWWGIAALSRLLLTPSEPHLVDVTDPIIVVEYQGTRLLDGRHRINRWVALQDLRLHAVIILTVDGVGKFLELPALP